MNCNLRILYFFLILHGLLSCNSKKNNDLKDEVTKSFIVNKEVKEILEYYGGNCSYTFGKQFNTQKSFVNIEISNSEVLEKFNDILSMPASNIAYLFFKKMDLTKNQISFIRVSINLKSNEKRIFNFNTKEIFSVIKIMIQVDQIIKLLTEKKFDSLLSSIDNEDIDKNLLLENLIVKENINNKIIEFIPYGYSFYKSDEKNYIHISGVIVRSNSKDEFSVDLSVDDKKLKNFQYHF